MSRANNREHLIARFAGIATLVIGCGVGAPRGERLPDDPAAATARVRAMATSCGGVERALDSMTLSGITGRPLLALVDELHNAATCEDPLIATRGATAARSLARAAYAKSESAALAELPAATLDLAIALRRAELLDKLERTDDARRALALVIAIAPDAPALAQFELLSLAAAAQRGDADEIKRLIDAAPIADRPRLAYRAVTQAPRATLERLIDGGPELAAAVATFVEKASGGPGAAIHAREQLVVFAPDDADAWDALARSRADSLSVASALEAWDRAIALAPAQPAFRIAPIQALVRDRQSDAARRRVDAIAREARTTHNVELLVTAAAAASLVDHALAVTLAREALALRPTDGNLAYGLAGHLATAGDGDAAAHAYVVLLVCGAHGRAWHRHEVAARLAELGAAGRAALDAKLPCAAVEPDDLAMYIATLRAKL